MKGFKVDISVEAIHRALFDPNYTDLVSTADFDFQLTFAQVRYVG